MTFKNEQTRRVFLKYALPAKSCSTFFVKMEKISQEYNVENLINAVANNKKIPLGVEEGFQIALSMCNKLAKEDGRLIDNEIVRRYFWYLHDDIVRKRYEKGLVANPRECIIYPGSVIRIDEKALVKTPFKAGYYRTDFTPNLEAGDKVVVHYSFIPEKISERIYKKLLKLKGKK